MVKLSIEISDKSTLIAAVRSSIRAKCAHCCCCWISGLWCCRKLEVSVLCALLLDSCYCCLGGSLCSVQQHTKMYRDLGQPGGKRMKKSGRPGMPDGRLRQTQPVTAVPRIWMCRPRTACGRQRWDDGIYACLCMLSVVYLV